MAVGFNFVFTASEEEGEVIIPPTCCLPTHPNLPLGAVLAQRTTHVGIRIEETLYNLQLSGGIDGWELLLNVHREIDGQPGLQDANELARGACASFLRHRTTAMELATTWLAQELPL